MSIPTGTGMRTAVHAVLPDGVDDPARPSGGNVYDRRVLDGLARLGRHVVETTVRGAWPRPGRDDLERLDAVLADLPDGALVLVDGLVASGAAAVVPRHARRLRLVVLLHMPLGPDAGEQEVLTSATAVLTTSAWSRERIRAWYGVRNVAVALPGVSPVEAVPSHRSAAGGTTFLCVAAVHPGKGHDLLFEALAALGDRAWTLTCVGSLDVDPDHVAALQTQVYARSWERRVVFTGPLTGGMLRAAYDAADLLVLPSRSESYGMVVIEALAHGLPVVATAVGGVPEAMGQAPVGALPGLLVPPEDPGALTAALRAWLDDPGLRERLSDAVTRRRPGLRRWEQTAAEVEALLERLAARGPAEPMAARGRDGGRR